MPLESILLSIGLLLLFAKIFGELTDRMGMSSTVGEVLAGVVLGPLVGFIVIGDFLENFITMGIIILLFLAGLEVKFEDIKNNVYVASAIAIGGGVLSLILGFLVGFLFTGSIIVGLAIGTILVSTSNGALFSLLMKTKHLSSPTGKIIVAATIADDIVGIMALSLFSVFAAHTSLDFGKISTLFFVAIGLYLLVMTAGEKTVRFALRVFSKFRDDQILLTMPIAFACILSYITNQIELSLAAGAFLAGMTMANSDFASSMIEPKFKSLGNGFFIPLFYASIGTMLIISDLNPYMVFGILLAAVLGKFLGTGLVSKLLKYRNDEIKLIGISLIPRGNENIALAQLVFLLGLISITVYTSIIFAMIATLIITPLLMKTFYK